MHLGFGQMTCFGRWDVSRRDTSKLLDSTCELSLFCSRHHHEKDLPRLTCQSQEGNENPGGSWVTRARPRLNWSMPRHTGLGAKWVLISVCCWDSFENVYYTAIVNWYCCHTCSLLLKTPNWTSWKLCSFVPIWGFDSKLNPQFQIS